MGDRYWIDTKDLVWDTLEYGIARIGPYGIKREYNGNFPLNVRMVTRTYLKLNYADASTLAIL